MFIQTEATPNPDTVKFLPGLRVAGFHGPFDYPDAASARSSGSPAATSPASCRVHTANAVALKMRLAHKVTFRPLDEGLPADPMAGSTKIGTNDRARNMLRAERTVSASIRPFCVAPLASRASNV